MSTSLALFSTTSPLPRRGEASDILMSAIYHLPPILSSEELMEEVRVVFTELSKDLRRLEDLPLTITSLQGTSATFRYTEVRM